MTLKNLITRRKEDDMYYPMLSMQRSLSRLFDDFFGDYDAGTLAPALWQPSMDISETDKELQVRAELPGLDEKDIHIGVANGVLTIEGEKREEKKDETKAYARIECRYGKFQRALTLPDYADTSKVSAVFKKGVLSLTIPKKEAAKPQRIDIKTDNS